VRVPQTLQGLGEGIDAYRERFEVLGRELDGAHVMRPEEEEILDEKENSEKRERSEIFHGDVASLSLPRSDISHTFTHSSR